MIYLFSILLLALAFGIIVLKKKKKPMTLMEKVIAIEKHHREQLNAEILRNW